jgi:hypothetical protein
MPPSLPLAVLRTQSHTTHVTLCFCLHLPPSVSQTQAHTHTHTHTLTLSLSASQVLADLVARGADPSNIRVVCIVAAPPALKAMADLYTGGRLVLGCAQTAPTGLRTPAAAPWNTRLAPRPRASALQCPSPPNVACEHSRRRLQWCAHPKSCAFARCSRPVPTLPPLPHSPGVDHAMQRSRPLGSSQPPPLRTHATPRHRAQPTRPAGVQRHN